MSNSAKPFPQWLLDFLDRGQAATGNPEGCMDLACEIALSSVEQGGGPFGAVIVDAAGELQGVGANLVLPAHDSTAHAEVVALRMAQQRLGTHNLAEANNQPLTMYTSCAPCIMCFGAIWWSGLGKLFAAIGKERAEEIGFDEGPVSPELWQEMKRRKGIPYVEGFGNVEKALSAIRRFAEVGRLY